MNENINEQNNEQNTETNYIEAIKNLKASTVSKEAYDKVVNENKTLIESLVNGTQVSTDSAKAEVKPTAAECKKKLFNPEKDLTNLEYVKRTLAYRNALMEETGEDCFVAPNHLDPNYDVEAIHAQADKVADVLQQCIDQSDGDDGVFRARLSSRLNDVRLPGGVKKR